MEYGENGSSSFLWKGVAFLQKWQVLLRARRANDESALDIQGRREHPDGDFRGAFVELELPLVDLEPRDLQSFRFEVRIDEPAKRYNLCPRARSSPNPTILALGGYEWVLLILHHYHPRGFL